MQAISRGRRFARAAAAKAKAAEGGGRRRGCCFQARHSGSMASGETRGSRGGKGRRGGRRHEIHALQLGPASTARLLRADGRGRAQSFGERIRVVTNRCKIESVRRRNRSASGSVARFKRR